jgi:hypothetical protein
VGGGRRDVLFLVLFNGNMDYIARLIEESVINVSREYPNEGVIEALQLLRPAPGDSLHKMQIKFFVLLNEDEAMRRNLANVKLKGVGSSLSVCSLCPHKAERFYDALYEEHIPAWVQCKDVSQADFMESLRQSYLCS